MESLSIIHDESHKPGTSAEDRDLIRKSFANFGSGRYSKINPEHEAEELESDDGKSKDDKANLAVDLQVLEGQPRFNKEWSKHKALLDLIDQEERENLFSFLHDTVDGSDLVQKMDRVKDEITTNTKNLLEDLKKEKK